DRYRSAIAASRRRRPRRQLRRQTGRRPLRLRSSKFSNYLIVVDPDPNNDRNPIDAKIVGRVLLTAGNHTRIDDTPTAHLGMGGQGVLPIPVVYHGWVQKLPPAWKTKLTPDQRNPIQ